MKKTRLDALPTGIPASVARLFAGAEIYDSSCSPTARVYYVSRGGEGFFIKTAAAESLAREAEMTQYFHSLSLGAEVLDYVSVNGQDWLCTRAVMGEDMTHADHLSEPARLASLLGECLRGLHDRPVVGCPGAGYLDIYLARAEENYRTGNYDASHFPDSFGYRSADEAWETLETGRQLLTADTLIHGDYCLPNIMLDGWRFSGFIDLGNSGVADRHIDLFWGAWSLAFNLGTDAWRDTFFDAYGREEIDRDILRVVAAAEVFG